jgi:hypothetical protein
MLKILVLKNVKICVHGQRFSPVTCCEHFMKSTRSSRNVKNTFRHSVHCYCYFYPANMCTFTRTNRQSSTRTSKREWGHLSTSIVFLYFDGCWQKAGTVIRSRWMGALKFFSRKPGLYLNHFRKYPNSNEGSKRSKWNEETYSEQLHGQQPLWQAPRC